MKEKGFWSGIGSIAAAASFTCFVESFRIPIVVAALALLAVAGYFTYFHKSPGECGPQTGKPLRRSRIKTLDRWVLPVIAVAVVAFAIFPNHVLSIFGLKAATEVRAGENESVVTLSVPWMTGPVSGPPRVKYALEGGKRVAVNYGTKTTRIVIAKGTDPKRLIEMLAKTGSPDSKEKPGGRVLRS